jgi:hypothetical protein
MKANGASGSLRFSARLKCTRPTRFQAGFNALRKACRSVPAAATDTVVAVAISAHRSRSTEEVRYSAPGIIGAVNTSVASSASVGGGTGGTTADAGRSASVPAAYRQSDVA